MFDNTLLKCTSSQVYISNPSSSHELPNRISNYHEHPYDYATATWDSTQPTAELIRFLVTFILLLGFLC